MCSHTLVLKDWWGARHQYWDVEGWARLQCWQKSFVCSYPLWCNFDFFFTLTSMSIITLMKLHFRYQNPHCIYHILSFLLFLDSSIIFLTVLCSFGENVIITFTKSIIGGFKFFLSCTRSFTCFTRPITFVFDQYWSPSLCHIIDQLDIYIHYH